MTLMETILELEALRRENERLTSENKQLKAQNDELMAGIVLKGWKCSACGCFNGEELAHRPSCRHCGLSRR